ncbi:MAG TPA: adenylate/guanylate cyclase domain-containing protein [Nitrososphaerales archaeon]|nr:adenylate/guanylate cyclase domain-containing protein [Nitrososphaerales archaeon]
MSQEQRELAAIMFTDMVGFTALTQSDERQSLDVLARHNRLLRPFFPKFNGREVKAIGDSFLVEFDSALEATLCAIEIQKFLHDYNIASRDEWKITLRIGIHLGDVVRSGDDILGDAVNIASRLQPLADPEGICVSDQVYGQVRNKLTQDMLKMEPRELKNVKFPVEVYKVVMPWEGGSEPMEARPDSKRIAVLPFANMSPDPSDEYFADGMTEELIDRLAHVRGLEVIARTSVMSYKGEKKKASQVARELGVATLLEGSVRKAGNRVRVTAQLISGATEGHMWSEHYDGILDDIFAVQSEIAEKVAGELKIQLLQEEKLAVEKKATKDTVAYTYYLQGMHLLQKLEEGALRNALSLFEKAVARDNEFARAEAGISDCYHFLAVRGYISFQEGIKKGRESALRALELDPDLAEGHYALAMVNFLADRNQESMSELRTALQLNPNLISANVLLADLSASLGYTQDMVKAAEKAYQLDPLSPRAVDWMGYAYFCTGREEEAMEHWKKTLHLDPYRTYRSMFDYYVSRKEYGNAEFTVKEMERISPTVVYTYLNRGFLAAVTGDEKTAREMIDVLDRGEDMSSTSLAGFIYYGLGDLDKFFEYMFRAARDHTLQATSLRYSPLFDGARKDPRFEEIFRISGMPYKP